MWIKIDMVKWILNFHPDGLMCVFNLEIVNTVGLSLGFYYSSHVKHDHWKCGQSLNE